MSSNVRFFPRTPNKPLVSVIFPSRGRPEWLLESINSLLDQADDTTRIEIILRIDEDDAPTQLQAGYLLERLGKSNFNYIIGPRGNGYQDIHLWLNELAKKSSGDWVFIWNDDARMMTKSWDTYLESAAMANCWHCCPEDICMAIPDIDGKGKSAYDFFMLRRKTVEVLNHVCMSPYGDAYIAQVMNIINTVSHVLNIKVHHARDTAAHEYGQRGLPENFWLSSGTLASVPAAMSKISDASRLLSHIARRDAMDYWFPDPRQGPGWYYWKYALDTQPMHVLLKPNNDVMLFPSWNEKIQFKVDDMPGMWRPRGDR